MYASLLGLRDVGDIKHARNIDDIRIPGEFQTYRYQFRSDQEAAKSLAFIRCAGFAAYAKGRADMKMAYAEYANADRTSKTADALPGRRNCDIWFMSEVLETVKSYYRLAHARRVFRAAYRRLVHLTTQQEAIDLLAPLWACYEGRDQDVAGLMELGAVLQLRSTVGRRYGKTAGYDSFGLAALEAMRTALEDGNVYVSLATLLRADNDYREIVGDRSINTMCQTYCAWLKDGGNNNRSKTPKGKVSKYEASNKPSVQCFADANCENRYLPTSDPKHCKRSHSGPPDPARMQRAGSKKGNLNDAR